MNTLPVRLTRPGADLPTRAHPTDAGLDLCAAESVKRGGERETDGATSDDKDAPPAGCRRPPPRSRRRPSRTRCGRSKPRSPAAASRSRG